MNIQITPKKKYALLALSGKQESKAQEMMDSLKRIWEQVSAFIEEGNFFIVFDLSHCDFINSSMISLFVQTSSKATEGGGWIKIIIPEDKKNMREILELVGMNYIADLFETENELLRTLPAQEVRNGLMP